MRAKLMRVGGWLACCVVLAAGRSAAADWPQFRGPGGAGSAETEAPAAFGPAHNVAWRAALPGKGPSSPIVVGQTVLVTAADGPHQQRLHLLAFDAASGKLRWQRTVWATGHTHVNSFGGVAANTPASDGRRVFALYSSNDLVACDLEGNFLWMRGLTLENPGARNDVGMASSPVVIDETAVVQIENPGKAFAVGLDAATGETRWTLPLESSACWTTPVALPARGGQPDGVILQTRGGLLARAARTGQPLWSYDEGASTISSTALWGDYLFAPIGGITALERADGGVRVAWDSSKLRLANVSPVVHRGRIYGIKSAGVLACADAATGDLLWQLRLEGPFWATPVAAGNHLYAVNHKGLVQIVKLGQSEGTLAGTASIDPDVLATPAVADGAIYFRTNNALWKIAAPR